MNQTGINFREKKNSGLVLEQNRNLRVFKFWMILGSNCGGSGTVQGLLCRFCEVHILGGKGLGWFS